MNQKRLRGDCLKEKHLCMTKAQIPCGVTAGNIRVQYEIINKTHYYHGVLGAVYKQNYDF